MSSAGWRERPYRKTKGARPCHWPTCFDAVADNSPVPAPISELPSDIQRDAKQAYRLFVANPAHPGLQFKKLEGEDDIYSARIGLGYRALAVLRGNRITWYWIGTHADYDRLV